MPEILQGKFFARAGAGLALAVGTAALTEQPEPIQMAGVEEERTIKTANFSLAVPVKLNQ